MWQASRQQAPPQRRLAPPLPSSCHLRSSRRHRALLLHPPRDEDLLAGRRSPRQVPQLPPTTPAAWACCRRRRCCTGHARLVRARSTGINVAFLAKFEMAYSHALIDALPEMTATGNSNVTLAVHIIDAVHVCQKCNILDQNSCQLLTAGFFDCLSWG